MLKAHQEVDVQCRTQAQAAGIKVDNISVADVAYPLITRRLIGVFQQQLVHVHNGCISDDPEHLPYEHQLSLNRTSSGSLPVTAWYKQGGGCSFCAAPDLRCTGPSISSVALAWRYLMRGWLGGSLGTIVGVCVFLGRRFHQTACHQRYIIIIHFNTLFS